MQVIAIFVAIRAQMVNSYFVLFLVAILAVAVWYWCSRMGIEVLFFNQILRFSDSQLLMDLAMYANQYFVAISTECCEIVAIKTAAVIFRPRKIRIAILMLR